MNSERRKIATVGIGCASWITKHGFAINVTRESQPFFKEIVPCGITEEEGTVCCLEEVVGGTVEVEEVGGRAVESFGKVFGVEVA